MYNIKCPQCGCDNKSTNLRCESCGNELNKIEEDELPVGININLQPTTKGGVIGLKILVNVILLFFIGPAFLIGAIFTGISVHSMTKDNIKASGYEETVARFVDYDDCHSSDGTEVCKGIYEWKVDGETYKGSPDFTSNYGGFKESMKVRYDPKDPSKYVMESSWKVFLIVGICMISFCIVVFIIVNVILYKMSKNSKKDEQVST